MSDRMISSDFLIQIGRADKGRTFVRVVHIATGKDRSLVGIGDANPREIAFQLAKDLTNKVESEALSRTPKTEGS
jgi:hypothetical protein